MYRRSPNSVTRSGGSEGTGPGRATSGSLRLTVMASCIAFSCANIGAVTTFHTVSRNGFMPHRSTPLLPLRLAALGPFEPAPRSGTGKAPTVATRPLARCWNTGMRAVERFGP